MNRIAQLLHGRTALGLWAGAVMWIVWLIGSILGTGNLDRHGQVIGTDHTAFHTAPLLVADGRGEEIFDYPDLTEFRFRQEGVTGKPGFLDPYRNPPFYLLPYAPTSLLPYLASYSIWAAIGLVALFLGILLLRSRQTDSTPTSRVLVWTLSFYPAFAVVSFGQNTFLSFAIFALTYRFKVDNRRYLAGLAAGLLLYKPQLLFGLGIWWLLDIRRAWPNWLGLLTTAIVLCGVSFVFLPGETVEWLNRLPDIARYDAFDFYNLHNCRGFGALLLGDKGAGNWFGLAGMALAVAWFGWMWKQHSRDAHITFAAAVFATLWGSPHTMTYEWALALIPALLLWDARPELRETWLPLFAMVWTILFIGTPLTKFQYDMTGGFALQLSVPVLAFVAIRAGRTLPTQCGI